MGSATLISNGIFDIFPEIMTHISSKDLCNLRQSCKCLRSWVDYFETQTQKKIVAHIKLKHEKIIGNFNPQFQTFANKPRFLKTKL